MDLKDGDVIVKAAEEVIEGKPDTHFRGLATGPARQSNMNANEVISHQAMKCWRRWPKTPIHPNDHCNMSQIIEQDTFPTAMHVACVEEIPIVCCLRFSSFAMHSMIKRKRQTSSRLAVPIRKDVMSSRRLKEFSGYTQQLTNGIERIEMTLPALMELAQGGTAVGTGLASPIGFVEKVAEHIASITGLPFKTAQTNYRVSPPMMRW